MLILPQTSEDDFMFPPNQINGDSITLQAIYENPEYDDHKLKYLYNFGDQWVHIVELLGHTNTITDDVICIGGIGHPPAEDCEGAGGWGNLQAAYLSPEQEDALEDRREWYEQDCHNGDPMGLAGDRLWRWDQDAVNTKLAGIYSLPDDEDVNAGWLGPRMPPPDPRYNRAAGSEESSSENEDFPELPSPPNRDLPSRRRDLSPTSRLAAEKAASEAARERLTRYFWENRNSSVPNAAQHRQRVAPTPGPASKEKPIGAKDCLKGLSFTFSGVLDTLNRDEGTVMIEHYGAKVDLVPSTSTSYIILGSGVETRKLEIFARGNLRTIDEDGLFDLIRTRPANGGNDEAVSPPIGGDLAPKSRALAEKAESMAARDALMRSFNENTSSRDAAQRPAPPPGPAYKERPTGAKDCLKGLSFVFTGILDNLGREEGIATIKHYGGIVEPAPTPKTNYVVLGSGSAPKKLEVIAKHTLRTINKDGLFELIRRRPANGGIGVVAESTSRNIKRENQRSETWFEDMAAEFVKALHQDRRVDGRSGDTPREACDV